MEAVADHADGTPAARQAERHQLASPRAGNMQPGQEHHAVAGDREGGPDCAQHPAHGVGHEEILDAGPSDIVARRPDDRGEAREAADQIARDDDRPGPGRLAEHQNEVQEHGGSRRRECHQAGRQPNHVRPEPGRQLAASDPGCHPDEEQDQVAAADHPARLQPQQDRECNALGERQEQREMDGQRQHFGSLSTSFTGDYRDLSPRYTDRFHAS